VYKSLLLPLNALSASILWSQTPASTPVPPPPSTQSSLSVHWEELTAAEFREAITRAQGTCLLPFGIMEKHGPHLPLGNDLLNVRTHLNAAHRHRCFRVLLRQIFEAKHEPGTVAQQGPA
jgi:creatinine amidohydrolase